MPKDTQREAREEDGGSKLSLRERLIRDTVTPPKEGMHSNAILASHQSTPMAEAVVIATHWAMIVNHEVDKAEMFILTLPETPDELAELKKNRETDLATYLKDLIDKPETTKFRVFLPLPKYDQVTYRGMIEDFTEGFHLLLDDLIYELCAFSLSIAGVHHKSTEALKQAVISSEGDNNNNEQQ